MIYATHKDGNLWGSVFLSPLACCEILQPCVVYSWLMGLPTARIMIIPNIPRAFEHSSDEFVSDVSEWISHIEILIDCWSNHEFISHYR